MDAKQSQLMNVSILFQLILIICFVHSGIDRASRRAHHVMSVPYEYRAPRAPPMLFYLRKKSSRLATICLYHTKKIASLVSRSKTLEFHLV
jgi:hypothetical protein